MAVAVVLLAVAAVAAVVVGGVGKRRV